MLNMKKFQLFLEKVLEHKEIVLSDFNFCNNAIECFDFLSTHSFKYWDIHTSVGLDKDKPTTRIEIGPPWNYEYSRTNNWDILKGYAPVEIELDYIYTYTSFKVLPMSLEERYTEVWLK